MISEQTLIVSIVGAVFASTGFWAFLTNLIQRKDNKESAESQMLKGLGHHLLSRGLLHQTGVHNEGRLRESSRLLVRSLQEARRQRYSRKDYERG